MGMKQLLFLVLVIINIFVWRSALTRGELPPVNRPFYSTPSLDSWSVNAAFANVRKYCPAWTKQVQSLEWLDRDEAVYLHARVTHAAPRTIGISSVSIRGSRDLIWIEGLIFHELVHIIQLQYAPKLLWNDDSFKADREAEALKKESQYVVDRTLKRDPSKVCWSHIYLRE